MAAGACREAQPSVPSSRSEATSDLKHGHHTSGLKRRRAACVVSATLGAHELGEHAILIVRGGNPFRRLEEERTVRL